MKKKQLTDEDLEKVTGGTELNLNDMEEITVDDTTTSFNFDGNEIATQRTIKE